MGDKKNNKDIFPPMKFNLKFNNGEIGDPATSWERKLSEMTSFFEDNESFNEIIQEKDPVIYKVYEFKMPEETGHLNPVTTVLYPGLVGKEFFMTKGHYHAKRFTAEIYWILSGNGVLLMQTDDNQSSYIVFKKGDLLYIPPCWAHRMVNTSLHDPLIFYGVYPADSGHDYGTITKTGFINKVIYDKDSENGFIIV